MKNTCQPSIKSLYRKNAQAFERTRQLDAAFTPEQMNYITSARACFEKLGKNDTDKSLSMLVSNLEKAGVRFNVLDRMGKKSPEEMEAEVRSRAGLKPEAPLRPLERPVAEEKVESTPA